MINICCEEIWNLDMARKNMIGTRKEKEIYFTLVKQCEKNELIVHLHGSVFSIYQSVFHLAKVVSIEEMNLK